MNLLAIRTQFVNLSGRHDLVTGLTDYVDNGANFFIQSGQRFLQSLIETYKSDAFILRALASSTNRVSFSDCLAIKEVWLRETTELSSGTVAVGERYEITATDGAVNFVTEGAASNTVGIRFTATAGSIALDSTNKVVKISYDDDEGSSNLKKVDRTALMTGLGQDGDVSISGLPYYYAIDIIRNQEIEGNETLRGILLGPPPDQYYKLSIEGKFKPKELTSDTDVNYWSENYPDTLLYAAFYSMEAFYRNQTGKREWLDSIMLSIKGVDFDIVGESMVDAGQMKG